MLVIIAIVTTLIAVFYYLYIKPLNYWKEKGVKQGNPVWFFGDNWKNAARKESLPEMVKRLYDYCPDERYFGIYQMTLPTLYIRDPELLKQICVKDFEYFVDHKSFIPENSDPLWSKNLFALKGQKWRDMRPILSPSFTSSKMRAMFTLMSQCSNNFVSFFLKKDEKIISVEMKDIFTRYCNDVIATVAFGVEIDSLSNPNNYFYLMGKEATNFTGVWKNFKFFLFILAPKLIEIFKMSLFSKEVNDFFYDLVDRTVKTREEQGIVRPDMIHLLMEAKKGKTQTEESSVIDAGFSVVQECSTGKEIVGQITNQDIASQAMIFFFGGFDSVSNVMCFMAYELAINPDIQNKLRQEIRDTQGQCEGNLTYEALLNMKYMDMVVSETLRKYPNAIVVDRVCTKPYTFEPIKPNEKPLKFNPGDVVWLPIYGLHHDPKYFPNPERFDPERFSDENKHKIVPYSYIPFGLGPRNCIGSRFALLENKAAFFHILSHFEIVPTEKTPIPMKFVKTGFSLSIEGGFWLGLKKIK